MRSQSMFFFKTVLENSLHVIKRGIALTSVILAMGILSPGEAFSQESDQDIPPEYQDKQMPNGWLTDPQVLAAGKAIYEGKTEAKAKCAGCHGKDGTPTRKGRGAKNFTDPSETRDSNTHWFWELSEGKRRTKMRSHKKHLTEEQRWQVIAYIRTFGQSSK